MPTLRILMASLVAVVGYAILQDQVSIRVSREYFTVGHDSSHLSFTDPTLLGMYWGVQGGLAGGIFLGIALGLTCQLGSGPKLGLADIWPGLLWLIATIALASLGAGAGTYLSANLGDIQMRGVWGRQTPPDQHVAFLAVAAAHWTTYLASILGSIVLCTWAGLYRHRLGQLSSR